MANITNINNIIDIGEATPTATYSEGNVVNFETYTRDLGLEATGTDGYYYSPTTIQTNGQNISGNNVVEFNSYIEPTTQENIIEIKPLQQLTEGDTGKVIKTGALAFRMAALTVTQAIMAGADIGWSSYKEYPEFWTDLSNALFSTNFLTTGKLDENTAIDVILRAVDDGSLRAYCDKRKVTEILETAYDLGAFAPMGTSKTTYNIGENQNLEAGGFSYNTVMGFYDAIATYGDYSFSREQIKTDLMNTISSDCNAFVYRKIFDGIQYEYRVYGYKVSPLNRVTVTTTGTDDFFTKSTATGIDFGGWFQIGLNNEGVVNSKGLHPASYGWEQADCKLKGADVILSSLGAVYTSPREGLIWNPEVPLPSSKPEIWTGALADWLAGSLELPTINPSTGQGAVRTLVPIPLSDPEANPSSEPTTDPDEIKKRRKGIVDDPYPIPEEPEKLPDFIIEELKPDPVISDNSTPSENPTGDTPIVIPPVNNNSSKLFTVYNPSWEQLNSLGGYLWSDDIATLIKELFGNNRMDAIISLHQVYCTPSTIGNRNIILGNLNSGVSAPVVNNQYVSVDCGTRYIAEMYGDARDYLNVDCQIYLPFIGFRHVDPHDIINCYVHIKYMVDVYTGSCLAQIIVTKGYYTQTLYTFEGNCSIQIPLTGSDRARIIGAIATTVATGLATGGAGMVAQGVGQIASGGAQANIQRTSGFSGNCGAMAIKKPYIVISRMKSSDAVDFNTIIGYPTNKTVYLVNCRGYTRVKDIHLDNLHCTDSEKNLLMTILKAGIQI